MPYIAVLGLPSSNSVLHVSIGICKEDSDTHCIAGDLNQATRPWRCFQIQADGYEHRADLTLFHLHYHTAIWQQSQPVGYSCNLSSSLYKYRPVKQKWKVVVVVLILVVVVLLLVVVV